MGKSLATVIKAGPKNKKTGEQWDVGSRVLVYDARNGVSQNKRRRLARGKHR